MIHFLQTIIPCLMLLAIALAGMQPTAASQQTDREKQNASQDQGDSQQTDDSQQPDDSQQQNATKQSNATKQQNASLQQSKFKQLSASQQQGTLDQQSSSENSSEHSSEHGAKPLVLQGGVAHSQKLAPVEKQYRRGAKVDLSDTKTLAMENKWYPLPSWASGKWTSIQATRTFAKDLKSEREDRTPVTKSTKMEFNWGFQKDKTGQVWEFAKEPYILTVDSSDKVILKKVMKREFLEADDSKVTLKLLTENVVVSKFTNQVVRTMQSENIQTCMPSEQNCMTCNASYKIFDEQGRAVEIGEETNKAKRIAEFKSIDEYEHKNMPELFKEFLRSQGKSELVD